MKINLLKNMADAAQKLGFRLMHSPLIAAVCISGKDFDRFNDEHRFSDMYLTEKAKLLESIDNRTK